MSMYEKQVNKFYSEIWENKHFQEVSNILHPDFVFRGSLGIEKKGYEGFLEYVNYIHSGLSDYKCTIKELLIQNDKAFAKMTFSGLHTGEFMGVPATNKNISWDGAALFNFRKIKVSELWVLGDVKNLEEQLSCN